MKGQKREHTESNFHQEKKSKIYFVTPVAETRERIFHLVYFRCFMRECLWAKSVWLAKWKNYIDSKIITKPICKNEKCLFSRVVCYIIIFAPKQYEYLREKIKNLNSNPLRVAPTSLSKLHVKHIQSFLSISLEAKLIAEYLLEK